MDIKKKPEFDLEKKRGIFFKIGLVCALGLTFIAFEWRTPFKEIVIYEPPGETIDVILPPITDPVNKEPDPLPKATEVKINLALAPEPVTKDEPADEPKDEPEPDKITPKVIYVEPPVDPPLTVDYYSVSDKPSFPGGEDAMHAFIAKHLQYPKRMLNNGITGQAFITFIIDENGKVVDIEPLKGHPDFAEEAKKVIEMMPDWKPGQQGTRKVKVKMVLPFTFKIKG